MELLDIAGFIITIDAMGTQIEIAKKTIDKKADYVLAAILILKIPYKLLRKLTNKSPRKPCSLVLVGSIFLRLRQILDQNENC